MADAPRETARQIAERIYANLDGAPGWGCCFNVEQASDVIAAEIASLAADLAQARQERDAAQKAMAYSSEQAHLEWTRANKAEGDLAAAEQARDEALKDVQCHEDELARAREHWRLAEDNQLRWMRKYESAARTALLEAAEVIEPTYPLIAEWLTTRAGCPRTARCANCGHTEPHNGPAGAIADACTHPMCKCGYFVAEHP